MSAIKKILVPIEYDVPVLDQVYVTKRAVPEEFKVTRDPRIIKKDIIIGISDTIWGIYLNSPHLGECPIDITRLVLPVIKYQNIETCSKCGEHLTK